MISTDSQDRSEKKVWKCTKCGTFFLPNPPEFRCPNCKGHSTAPTNQFDKSKHQLYEEPEGDRDEITCSKCGTLMHRGFMVERNAPLQIFTLGEGIYWSPSEGGLIGKRVAVMAYACPTCGYIEHYVRRLHSDKPIIESAPTK
jgi:rubrerythrin